METLTGFIIDLTDERRGPVKFYKRFTMITTNKENVSGWIFSSNAIEETTAGNVLSEAVKKQSEVTIKGKISTEAGGKRCIKIFLTHKHDQPINISKSNGKLPESAIINVSILDAITSEGLSRISIKIINHNPTIYYEQDGKEHRYKTCVIADDSCTNILIIYDNLIESIELNKNYTFTNIKMKKIYNTVVLSTTSNTTVCEITKEINANLDDLDETMDINLNDIITLTTTINEVGEIKEDNSCSICKQTLVPVTSKPNLIKCVNCKKIMLSNKQNMQASVLIQLDDSVKMTFWTIKGLLFDLISRERPGEHVNAEEISEILLLHGPWKMNMSIFRRQLLEIKKE